MSYRRPILSLAAALLFATPALAQDEGAAGIDPADLEGDSITIGLAAGNVPSYDGSDDRVWTVVPLARGKLGGVSFLLRGNRVSADLIDNGAGPGWDFQLGPIAQANFNRNSAIRDAQVKALGKVDVAIELGGYVGIARKGVITSDFDTLGVSVGYVHDVAGTHDSYVITPSIDYGTPLSTRTFVSVSLSADYVGGGYADTYFSVTPSGSVASGLPVFTAEKGWKDWTASLFAAQSLTGNLTGGLTMVGAVSYRRMLEDSARSPIVSIAGSRNQLTGMLGLAYTF